ncbi:MAG: Rab family GTPase [Candidatus Asgardarchaeia archaeon]
MEEEITYNFKVIMTGDAAVGKTSIVKRYMTHTFKEDYLVTIGVQVSSKVFDFRGIRARMILWDVAGQKAFNAVVPLYFQGADFALIVYDITNRRTFLNVRNWGERIKEESPNAVTILVGNKVDLNDKRAVSPTEGYEVAKSLGCQAFFETSAKTGEGIDEVFQTILRLFFLRRLKEIRGEA